MKSREGLKIARLLMVLSSVSPVFVLWAVRGSNGGVPNVCFVLLCVLLFLTPNLFLLCRIRIATKKKGQGPRELVVGQWDDRGDHLLVYLFTMLLPFYSADLGTLRSVVATFIALAFVVFLFWHLNLHYMNLIFAMFGYRIFMICPPNSDNPFQEKTRYSLITRRVSFLPDQRINAYRVSDTVYLEAK